MSTIRDEQSSFGQLEHLRAEARDTLDELDVRPLSARSLLLSFLLGTHPPDVSAARLVAFGELFGQRPGTIRTALSRMVATGEATVDDGRYRLAGRLLDRQRELDRGQAGPSGVWDGAWRTAVVTADRRSSTERRHFRSLMVGARFGELRADVWLRPANVPLDPTPDGAIITTGMLTVGDPQELTRQLWDVEAIERTSSRLAALLSPLGELLTGLAVDPDPARAPLVLRHSFDVSTACVRHLRIEPQLPAELANMPASASLRTIYRDVNESFRSALELVLGQRVADAPGRAR